MPVVTLQEDYLENLLSTKQHLEVTIFGRTHVNHDWEMANRVLPDEFMLFYSLENDYQAVVLNRDHNLAPHSLLLLSPGMRHTVRNRLPAEPVTLYHLRFRLKETAWPAKPNCWILHHRPELSSPVRQMYAERHTGQPLAGTLFRCLLAQIMATAFRGESTRPSNQPRLSQRQQEAVYDHMATHRREHPQPADLARAAGLSADYFTRAFRATFGVAPKTWLLRERMEAAAAYLLESTATISEVADHLGYDDLYRFSKQFKQIHGLSPRVYRTSR